MGSRVDSGSMPRSPERTLRTALTNPAMVGSATPAPRIFDIICSSIGSALIGVFSGPGETSASSPRCSQVPGTSNSPVIQPRRVGGGQYWNQYEYAPLSFNTRVRHKS